MQTLTVGQWGAVLRALKTAKRAAAIQVRKAERNGCGPAMLRELERDRDDAEAAYDALEAVAIPGEMIELRAEHDARDAR